MQRAASLLAGRHDFVCFRAPDPSKPTESTIVVVDGASVTLEDDLVLFRIEASHFLWRMVRRIVGVLVKVGKRELSEEEFRLSPRRTVRYPLRRRRMDGPRSRAFPGAREVSGVVRNVILSMLPMADTKQDRGPAAPRPEMTRSRCSFVRGATRVWSRMKCKLLCQVCGYYMSCADYY